MRAVQRVASFLASHLLAVYAAVALLYLLAPIAAVTLFSFNDPVGRSNYSWSSFTFDNWLSLFRDPTLVQAVGTSLRIALISTTVATILGTLMALALVRYKFRLRKSIDLFVFLPLATPEIVLGASLLTLFVTLRIPLGDLTLILAHVMFNVSYVVVTLKARLAGFDMRLEEAAADLGANPLQTFWRITFPLILPGIAAGALLAFGLSLDDFVITRFNAGQTQTFPVYVYLKVQKGIPPQVNAFATLFFVATVTLDLVVAVILGLIVAGALNGTSGLLLSIIMCKAMNRSFANVLFGAFGQVQEGAAGAEIVDVSLPHTKYGLPTYYIVAPAEDRKSTRLNSSHMSESRMPSSA